MSIFLEEEEDALYTTGSYSSVSAAIEYAVAAIWKSIELDRHTHLSIDWSAEEENRIPLLHGCDGILETFGH